MSKQIAVRLSDEIVVFMDYLIADGKAKSRAEIVARALAREQRLAAAERDVEVLTRMAQRGESDDLDDLVAWSSANALDVDVQ